MSQDAPVEERGTALNPNADYRPGVYTRHMGRVTVHYPAIRVHRGKVVWMGDQATSRKHAVTEARRAFLRKLHLKAAS